VHDNQVEDRVRAALRADGDALPLTITPDELERRLVLRRRDQRGRRLGLIAAGVAVVLVGSLAVANGRWFDATSLGATPQPTAPEQTAIRVHVGYASRVYRRPDPSPPWKVLIALEAGLALTLLIGAGLLLRSAIYLQRFPTGMDLRGVAAGRLSLPPRHGAGAGFPYTAPTGTGPVPDVATKRSET